MREKGPKGCLFLVDAVAGAAWLPIDVEALGCDMLALAGHKLDGPKGVGALYLKKGTHILAQLQGGNQERFRRAGTEDVAGAVGMGVAFELAVAEREVDREARAASCAIGSGLRSLAVDGVELTGHPRERLPNLLSVVVGEADGASIVVKLDLRGRRRVRRARRARPARPSRRTSSPRWAIPTTRRAARSGSRSGARRPRPRSTRPSRSFRGSSPNSRAAAAVLAANPLGEAVAS